MKLTNAQITDFRCIQDSTPFRISDVTCLVGKNESGKTAVLRALEKLNAIDPANTKYDQYRDYPRNKLTEYDENTQVLQTSWLLEKDDIEALEADLCKGVLKSNEISIQQKYTGGRVWVVQVDQAKLIEELLKSTGCAAEPFKVLKVCKTTSELKSKAAELAQVEDCKIQASALLAKLEKFRDGEASLTAIDILHSRLPKFLYFDNYDLMGGNVSLEKLRQDVAQNKTDKKDAVFLAFLELAGTSLEEMATINRYEALKAKVESASIKISSKIFKYWTQNKNLKVEFSLEAGRAGDPAPFNAGNVMRTRILNKLHDMTVEFDNRSAGFVWFFSFLVLFSSVEKKHGKVVILLDEPGLNLHGKAQSDLLRYIYAELKPQHQVIFTTHSPFMVPAEDISSVRTVEDVVRVNEDKETQILGTKVGDQSLSTDKDTLFPLQAALGYEITQTLFIGKHTLLVEGPSDILYLQWASSFLAKLKRESLDRRWTICPSGGVDKIGAFLSLFGGNKLHVAVLIDYAAGQKNKVEGLRKSELLQAGHVFTAADIAEQDEADVEDILGEDVYLEIVNKAFDLSAKNKIDAEALKKSGEKSPRVVKRVEAAFRVLKDAPECDHYRPAFWLIQNPEFLAEKDLKETLNRFEGFFQKVNKLLI